MTTEEKILELLKQQVREKKTFFYLGLTDKDIVQTRIGGKDLVLAELFLTSLEDVGAEFLTEILTAALEEHKARLLSSDSLN
ncbi:MAG: hypothetical protein ACUZ8H_16375 [Candidatus Anammoxibacter sp.]